jgi:hypothetical protein
MPRLSFKKANARRHELIDKMLGGGLTPEERAEYEKVDRFCGEWIEKRYPLDWTPIRETKARLGLTDE